MIVDLNFSMLAALPYILGIVSSALLATLGVILRRDARPLPIIEAMPFKLTDLRTRYLLGNSIGIPLVGMLVSLVLAGNIAGSNRTFLLIGAMALYLYLGFVLPRRPLILRQQRARKLRQQTPGFMGFIRVALLSCESPIDAMQRYIARPQSNRTELQAVVTTALRVSTEQRVRPFAALAIVARRYACRELVDLADVLAQAETEGERIDHVLAAQQSMLEFILSSEYKRMIRRRSIYLLLLVGISLVVGILLNLLWVMTVGGSVISL